MTFFTPALLLGAALVAVPIVLHLARRSEPRRLLFPALRLLEKTRKKQETHLRLRRLLLLALRCAAIALLALALARPILTPPGASPGATGGEQTGLAMALVFDNAANMGYRQAGQTRLEAAVETARWIIQQTPSQTQIVLNDRGRGTRPRVADAGVALANLDRLDIAPASRPLDEAVAGALAALAETSAGRREAYVLTDLTVSAWPESVRESIGSLLDANPDVKLRLVDVGVSDSNNAGVRSITLSSDALLRGQPLSIDAGIAITGEPPQDAVVRLWIDGEDGKPIKRDERPLSVEEGRGGMRFTLSGLDVGDHTGRVQLVTSDGMPADDTRYFAVRVVRPPAVWIVAQTDAQAVYLREAIGPTPSTPGVESQTLMIADFSSDRQLARLDPAQVSAVLLVDPPPLRGSVWRRLADYVAAGGGVGVFLGGAATLDGLNDADSQSVLPTTFRWRSRDRTHLSPIDYAHPSISDLAPYAQALPWPAFPVLQRWETDRVSADAEVTSTYADGSAAIIARQIGRGRVLVMTTPVSDAINAASPPWNLLPTGEDPWPFLLLAQSLTDYLATEPRPPLSFEAGEPATVVTPASGSASYLIQLPGGDTVRQTAALGSETLAVRLTEEPGVYRVATSAGGGVSESRFVVNLAEGIGDLARLDSDALVAALGAERVEIVLDRKALSASIDRGRVGRELFGWVLALMIAAFAGEQVVSNRFYRTRGGEDA